NHQQNEELCVTGGNAGVIADNVNVPTQIYTALASAAQMCRSDRRGTWSYCSETTHIKVKTHR
uniref:hypothetical protein n=1 Tax=Acinetobacter baumannii TaxID=470 RepID=UPI001BB46920